MKIIALRMTGSYSQSGRGGPQPARPTGKRAAAATPRSPRDRQAARDRQPDPENMACVLQCFIPSTQRIFRDMKIYQAYMDVEQRAFVCDGAIPFDASANCAPGTREYELFKQLHADPANRDGNEPWGLVSWKFEHKAPAGFRDFHAFCRSAFDAGADCAFINPMIGNEAVYANGWEQGIHCAHTGIEKIAYFLEQKMGIQVATVCAASTFAFCNYFVANRRFWDAYFAFIDRALALLDAEAVAGTEVGQIYSGSGQYERDASAAMRIFVIERLFSA
ncbi:MAG TPA: hypothetical protein VM011_00605, partial [Gammaproteobacteria bacterium]|nr:hypothetical protein [Gammaproteobacteria bacterium]